MSHPSSRLEPVGHDTLAAVTSGFASLRPDTPALAAYEAFSATPTLYAIAVVDEADRPIGVLNRFKFLERLSRPFGRDLFMRQPLSAAMHQSPLVVDEQMSLDELSEKLVRDDERYLFDGFIVTRQGRYVGTGTGYDVMRRLTDRKHAALFHMAHHDALTGLPNRQLFNAQLSAALNRGREGAMRVAVLYVDLDRFKLVNDNFGHAIGDLLLQAIAERLRRFTRMSDCIARLSGDEFAMIISDAGSDVHVDNAAAQLLEVIRAPLSLDAHHVTISCSIGVAVFPTDAGSQEGLLRAADAATYYAKRFRNTHERYRDAFVHAQPSPRRSFGAVRQAIDRGHLSVCYQPQIVASTGALDGVEALVRWDDPHEGRLPTLELIRLAEDAGLISEITDYVLHEAMKQVRAWRISGLAPNLSLAVNISGVELRDGLLVPMVERHLAESGLPASALELEITESAAMLSGSGTHALLNALTGLGIRLSIDDFGTGYSSLSRLRRLPVQSLKIDRAFVEDIGHPESGALAEAIILMGHSLGLSVTAEGVQTPEQRAFLVRHRCDRLQGYLISHPLSSQDTDALIRRVGTSQILSA